jgi:hypothetical protein
MAESVVQNIIKCKSEINEKGKVARALCGLPTSTRNRSAITIQIERLLTV